MEHRTDRASAARRADGALNIGWAYQHPYTPASHPDQRYYRSVGRSHTVAPAPRADTQLRLFRFADTMGARLDLVAPNGEMRADLDIAALKALRDACTDALVDIEAFDADRERRESFAAIQEELNAAEDAGLAQTVMYMHPDVYYVAPDQVEAKVRELEHTGAKRYIVLPDPTGAAA